MTICPMPNATPDCFPSFVLCGIYINLSRRILAYSDKIDLTKSSVMFDGLRSNLYRYEFLANQIRNIQKNNESYATK